MGLSLDYQYQQPPHPPHPKVKLALHLKLVQSADDL